MFKMTELRDYHIQTPQGVRLSYVATLGLEAGESQPLVTHTLTEIMSVKSGKGEFLVDGESFLVSENSVLVVNADTMHGETGNSLDFTVYILGVENYFIDGALQKPVTFNLNRINFLAEQIVLEYERGGANFIENASMMFSIIINDLLEEDGNTLKPYGKRGSNEIVNMVKKHLDEHYLENVSIKMLAEKFFTNKNTLMHNFKKQTGFTIVDYVLQKRLAESKNWLKISELSVAQIADRCLFTNPSYFTRYFKKRYGITPAKYRKMANKNNG